MEEKKNNSNGCVIVFGIILCIIIVIPFIMSVINSRKVTDEEVISFAKEEVKQKLRYPSTAKFQNAEIIGNEDDKYVVSMYSVSKDKNYEEGRLRFIVGVENNKGILNMFNIATNEDTCNVDVAEEFEDLVAQRKYSEIYDNLFSSTLKSKLSKSDFISYNLDFMDSNTEATPTTDSDNYLKYVTTITIDKNGQSWLMKIKNGMIYEFDKI